MSTPVVGSNNASPRIVYDEIIEAPGKRKVIVKLYSNGIMLIGYDDKHLRKIPFMTDPMTHEPWIPNLEMFRSIITDEISLGSYDLDSERLDVPSVVRGLCGLSTRSSQE